MNIELAVVSVVFGPFILIRFLRSLGAAAASAGQGPPPRFQPKQGLKRKPKLAPSQWDTEGTE